MKNINIKISRDFLLIIFLGLIFISIETVSADLDKNFRENFAEITQEQCFNSIDYSVDDLSGIDVVSSYSDDEDTRFEWKCFGGKCQEYKTVVNCLFDDAFQQAVNKVNLEVQDHTGESSLESLIDTDAIFKNCGETNLLNVQNDQENLGFTTNCSADHLTESYSACRVTETVLNEFCGYQNFLAAKARDYKSFKSEEHDAYTTQLEMLTLFDARADKYLKEIEKTKQAFIDASFLYKNFIHNYRIHAWLSVINSRLEDTASDFVKIMEAIKKFPAKFIDANSLQ